MTARVLPGLFAAVVASVSAVMAADQAETPERTADLSLLAPRSPNTAGRFPIEPILDSLSQSLGLSFVFDSRVIADKTIRPVGPDRNPEKALKRELQTVDLALHKVAEKTYAITHSEPELFVAPAPGAQDDVQEPEPIDTIVVMASMPLQAESAGSKRLFKIDSDDLAYLNATSPAEALYDLPQSLASFTPSNTALLGSAAGISLADLRGLAPKRTMVLMNGRRGTITSGGNGDIAGFDLNSVAEPFIERIEVLNLPAGARFGSAAVAGAVNFVTKSNLEGLEAGVKAGISEQGDAETISVYALGGRTFDSFGNITIGVNATRTEGLIGADRPFSSTPYGFALNDVRSNAPDAAFLPGFGGSSISERGYFSGVLLDTGEFRPFSSNDVWIPQSDGSVSPLSGASNQLFNWAAWQSVVLPSDRILGQFTYNTDLSKDWSFFVDYHAGVSATNGQLAPLPATALRGGDPTTGDAAVIPLINPTLPQSIRDLAAAEFGAAVSAVVFDHRYLELGPRRLNVDRRYQDLASGVRYATDNGFELALTYRFARNRTAEKERGRLDLNKLQIALNPVACSAVPDCVEVDFFTSPSISFAAIDFLRTPELRNKVIVGEHELTATASGPFAFNRDEDGRYSFGVELRRSLYEEIAHIAPDIIPIGSITGGDARNTEDAIDAFAEVETPLLRFAGFPGDVDGSMAARLSQSSVSGTAMNFEGGVEWRPINGVSVFTRQAIGSRAPNLIELFGIGATLETYFQDPCASFDAAKEPVIAANCQSGGPLGVGAGFEQKAFLSSVTDYGNPDLEPEQIRSQAYGLTLTPTDFGLEMPGRLQLSAVWLDVEIEDAVNPSLDTLFDCYSSPDLSSKLCGVNPRTGLPLIVRDPFTRQIVSYDSFSINDGEFQWRGLDIEARYSTKPQTIPVFDSVWLSALHTYTDRVLLSADGMNPARQDGLINYPRHRTLISLGADLGEWSFVAYGNRRGRVLTAQSLRPEARVPAAFYLDATVRFDFSERAYIQANVQNITNEEPAITAFNDVGNFAPEYYDPIGRRYSVAVRIHF
ncbi:MAG: TonB-dependent receptor [Parvularculaceae bacterium]|nr:TonB-dependent receptor [Parvularculaceae bacterium]